jgi:hypothetical protein
MNPFVHEAGNKVALEIAQKAQQSGLTTMFNDDPQVSVDTFKFYKNYNFWNESPESSNDDANAFATLVRECVHFEVETLASMLTFGLDLKLVYPQITLSYMFRSCRAVIADKYRDRQGAEGTDVLAERFAKELVETVYGFVRSKLDTPAMSWEGVTPSAI